MVFLACCFFVSEVMRRISALYSAVGRSRRSLQVLSKVATARSKVRSVELDRRGERMRGDEEVDNGVGVVVADVLSGVFV